MLSLTVRTRQEGSQALLSSCSKSAVARTESTMENLILSPTNNENKKSSVLGLSDLATAHQACYYSYNMYA